MEKKLYMSPLIEAMLIQASSQLMETSIPLLPDPGANPAPKRATEAF